jgi:hypothetical protein
LIGCLRPTSTFQISADSNQDPRRQGDPRGAMGRGWYLTTHHGDRVDPELLPAFESCCSRWGPRRGRLPPTVVRGGHELGKIFPTPSACLFTIRPRGAPQSVSGFGPLERLRRRHSTRINCSASANPAISSVA